MTTNDRLAPKTIYTVDKANELAIRLTKEDKDGWTYTVVICGVNKAKIMVTDEDGNKLGYL